MEAVGYVGYVVWVNVNSAGFATIILAAAGWVSLVAGLRTNTTLTSLE